ncbi:creatininase family protein [bacterium]|nr:creatininase family protein [bacterium]RQV97825.1 MAG: creatininase family protein [bacterium]
MRPYILREANWKNVRKTDFHLAILPWGATEAHNYHLPYGTDNMETESIAEASAKKAWEKGAKVIVLPIIPFGVNAQQLDIKLTINMNPSTQAKILADVVESLENHQIRKLVILNGHGGNDFRQMIRERQRKTHIFLCTVAWYAITKNMELFDEPGDHAGEMETSLMMHLNKDLLLPLKKAGNGSAKQFRIAGFKEGWAWAPRQWTKVTRDTGVGNPKAATEEKGKRYFETVVNEISNFLIELATLNPDDLYE